MIAYQADWVCPGTAAPVRQGSVVVEQGRIVRVTSPSGQDEQPDVECVTYPGCAIIPGFVNPHTHLELTLFRGLLANLPFPEWIAQLVRIKYGQCTPEALKRSAQVGAIEMLRAGVTAVGEVMDTGAGWDAMLEFGLQGIAYQEVFGPAEDAAAGALSALREKVDRHRKQQSATQRVGVSPHAPYTVSKDLYEGVRDYARGEGLRMTAHIAESGDETMFVRDGLGPFAAAHSRRGIPVVARHCLPIAYLDRLGLLGPDMLLVHAIEMDAADMDRIRESGTSVVHCPKSNAYLGHGVARVADMRACGIPVALGTDSVASNDSIDMFGEMRLAQAQQGLSYEDVFRMATIEGAGALGMASQIGSLEAGKRADFAVVELKDLGVSPVEGIVRFARPVDVRATFVGGREVLVDDRELRAELQKRLPSIIRDV
jgi:5-methylthioadenosine/S-adenosylhomocysteine deaminase